MSVLFALPPSGKGTLLAVDGSFFTEEFSSTADILTVSLAGRAAGEVTVTVFVHGKNGCREAVLVGSAVPSETGAFSYTCRFDSVHLAVYKNAQAFSVSVAGADCVLYECTVTEAEDRAEGKPAARYESRVIRQADGTAVVPVRTAEGETLVSTVPKNVLLIGNSLLLGMYGKYGMCASSPRNDYAFYVTEALQKKEPACTVRKLYGSLFEGLEDPALFDKWLSEEVNPVSGQPPVASFTEDTDLIVIQLGDNVNTPAKKETFPVTVPRLMQIIRSRCPRARVIWVYGWYNKYETHDFLTGLFQREGIEWVDLSGLRAPENEGIPGQRVEKPDGTTEVTNKLFLTHPGDGGMRKIAEALLAVLGIREG